MDRYNLSSGALTVILVQESFEMMSGEQIRGSFYFVGERLCIDFINTEVIDGGTRMDLLRTFDDLIDWSAAAHIVSRSQAKEIARRWSGKPDAERTLQRAIALRGMLREMVERLAAGRKGVPHETVDAINETLRLGDGDLELVRTKDGYETRRHRHFSAPAQLLVPVAESAADLLSKDDGALVRKCQNPQCILHFYDTTKNHARRWCSMTACGNRAKVAAHYRRARQLAR